MSEINQLNTVYFPHRCDVDQELFSPIASEARTFECMSGYFSSGVLRELAHAISFYLLSSDDKKMRFIIGPNLSSSDDIDALHSAVYAEDDLIPFLFEDVDISLDNLKSKTVKMLSYLVATNRLEIKIAVMSDSDAIFHNKLWLFETDQGNVAIHGSGNSTAAGTGKNSEQFNVTRTWHNANEKNTYDLFKAEFDLVWSEMDDAVLCAPLNEKTLDHVNKIYQSVKNNDTTLKNLKDFIKSIIDESSVHSLKYPKIPSHLNDREFDLMDHQKRAISLWSANEFKGILELATGSGKTITSIYAATRVYEARKKQNVGTVLIVSVPYIELAKQWVSNLTLFNVAPIECWDSRFSWAKKLADEILAYQMNAIDFICIVVVNKTLSSDYFRSTISGLDSKDILFIGDECHRHGSAVINKSLPEAFYRIGLSATPFNSDDDDYDNPFPDEARVRLESYYGKIVDSYTLADAINDGVLCEYDYHIIPVYLSQAEQDLYDEISLELGKLMAIKMNGGLSDGQKMQITILSGRRSRILGGAENKIRELEKIVSEFPIENRSHTLFYCGEGKKEKELKEDSDLDEHNINQISRTLFNAGWSSSRFTSQEKPKERRAIMADFVEGNVNALVSLKVLDEGVDVPICNKAFILASTRNRRQYVQRRGRVLRPHSTKTKSVIYDFVILPAKGSSNVSSSSLIKAELERVDDFCALAKNRRDVENKINQLGMRDG